MKHPITGRTIRRERRREFVELAEPPNPEAWFTFLCDRCGELFQCRASVVRCCNTCWCAAYYAGVIGGDVIGEASGS